MKIIFKVILLIIIFTDYIYAQQDPQYTQYMYNTMSVNPAYAGSRGNYLITALGRSQWVGLEGAPNTQTLSFDMPLGTKGVGLGINLVNDGIGPANETYLDANISYAITTSEVGKLSFGLKLGGRMFSIDPEKGIIKNRGDVNLPIINNKFLPTIGAGVYYYTRKFYTGLAIPNFLSTEHYSTDVSNRTVAKERFHSFLISGFVFQLSEGIKFKPAVLMKIVSGAPLSLDVSANFMFNKKFVAGLAWRWDDSISALLGFQVTERLYAGYSYDLTTSNLRNYNSGTHEIMLRYEILKLGAITSPRFF